MPDRPYLDHYLGPGPLQPSFKIKVFTLHGTESFMIHGYRLDVGYLILYEASETDKGAVRANVQAVFAPGGWLGYALDEAQKGSLVPIGFEFRREDEEEEVEPPPS